MSSPHASRRALLGGLAVLPAIGAASAVSATPVTGGDRTAWNAALAALAVASETQAAAAAARRRGQQAVEQMTPIPAVLTRRGRGYWSADCIATDDLMPADRKAERLSALRDWLPGRESAEKAFNVDPTGEDCDDEYDAIDDARRALWATPAPDLAALTEKMRLYLDHALFPMAGQSSDNAADVSSLVSGSIDAAAPALMFQDLLRMTGATSKALDARDFDGEAWLDHLIEMPGYVFVGGKPVYLAKGGAVASGESRGGIEGWEALSIWERRAVQTLATRPHIARKLADRFAVVSECARPDADGETEANVTMTIRLLQWGFVPADFADQAMAARVLRIVDVA